MAFLLLTSFVDEEDCEDEDFLDECAEVIDGYKFLKANKITIDNDSKVEYKSVFSKGSTYKLTACNVVKITVKQIENVTKTIEQLRSEIIN
jgi:hypothetical protein